MSELNLLLLEGFVYCPQCLAQIPATFLACPHCYGLVQENDAWVAPAPPPKMPPTDEEQPGLFGVGTQEYPA